MAKYTHVGPGLPPLHGARAIALILGSFPSPKIGPTSRRKRP